MLILGVIYLVLHGLPAGGDRGEPLEVSPCEGELGEPAPDLLALRHAQQAVEHPIDVEEQEVDGGSPLTDNHLEQGRRLR